MNAPGLHLFPAGAAWEKAYFGAVDFLAEHPRGVVLLGPGVGEGGKHWLQEERLRREHLSLGARVQPWDEWVKGRARSLALSRGQGFRTFNEASKREFFRSLLALMEERGLFQHVQSLWHEDRFFDALLACVEEARGAGLAEEDAVMRARELLAQGNDAVTREAYDDFWKILRLFEAKLAEEPGLHDAAGLAKLAASAEGGEEADLFLLGFTRLSLLETELLQGIARHHAVVIPLAAEPAELRRAQKGEDVETTAGALAQGLLTGFVGAVHVAAGEESPTPARRFLAAHVPAEEARSAAALAAQALGGETREARFVLPPGALEEESFAAAFREELGLPRRFHDRTVLHQPVARLFFHTLELKRSGYGLHHALEFAQLLQFTLGRFYRVPALAHAAGVREGLAQWRDKARETKNAELGEFAEMLTELDRRLPKRATAAHFAEAVNQVAELAGIGELARRALDGEIEREAHAALAGLVRNAQLLASAVKGEMEFAEFLREWRALLERTKGESPSFYPRVQFYRYGEWLPPAQDSALTVALGFQRGVEPRQSFHFFLEEGARRKLAEFRLPSQAQEDLQFLDYTRRLARLAGPVVFSHSRLDSGGKEQLPSWISAALPLAGGAWPEVARETIARPFRAEETVRTPPPALPHFSASLLELYRECPFKAFALKVLHLEDKMQAASLDLGHLEQGSLVHKTLELFYGPRQGKEIRDPEARARILEECLTEAVKLQKVEYFKGSEELLGHQVKRLGRMLREFVESDAAQYAAFPYFGAPLVEQEVSGVIAGKFPWKGKIDRVDLDEANRRFLVIDYKKGASVPGSGEIKTEFRRFQLPLYLSAMEELRPGWSAIGGLYVSLRTGERKQGIVRKEFNRTAKTPPGEVSYYELHARTAALTPEEEFRAVRARAESEAARVAGLISEGVFDVTPIEEEACLRCEARPACRVRELRAPPRAPWPRRIPRETFAALLAEKVEAPPARGTAGKGFNEEQSSALARRGEMVFVEASAGTGKTTVIVERIQQFLRETVARGEPAFRAVEKFAAISFTDKSAQELAARVSASLLAQPGLGLRAASQAMQQVTTIHGFCRRILSDFPVEAGISPMAELLDERQAETLRENVFDEFFLANPEEARASLEALFGVFPRAKIESLIRSLLDRRLILEKDLALYRQWLAGEIAAPGSLVPLGDERVYVDHLLRAAESFFRLFDERKAALDLLDFNDLEARALRVLESPHARAFYRERFELLLVDEFQDTNSVQREILERIARPGLTNLFVVGDAKQSIYRFRAADVSVFQQLRREAEEKGNLVTLFRNYRSRRELVEAANLVSRAVFPAPGAKDAPDFEAVAAEARAERAAGGLFSLVEYGDPAEKLSAGARRAAEAELVVKLVREQLARGRAAGEIAVLFRKLSGNDVFLRALTAAGIPFRVGSSKGFYSQQVVLDAIALLRAVYGANNDMALLALLRSPWARLTPAQVLEVQRRGGGRAPLWDLLTERDAPLLFAWRPLGAFLAPSELLELAFRHYPLDRREHLQVVKLLGLLATMESEQRTRTEIVDRLSRWAGWEREEDSLDDGTMPEPGSGGAVQVMTVHAAKGLEFDVTILPDLAAPPLPDRSALRVVPGVGLGLKLEDQEAPEAYTLVGERNRERELAESKRLLYVALTRAKEECVLLLPREGEKKAKAETWAGLVRASELGGVAVKRPAEEVGAAGPAAPTESLAPETTRPAERPPLRLETSITEIAAYQFCPEFHRRKFVQAWDDRVVGLWPKPPGSFRKNTGGTRGADQGRDYAARLLRKLQVEKKERGIALHRVLERLTSPVMDRDLCRLWLKEAYEAQGVDIELEAFHELADLDLELLARFLASPVGQDLFNPAHEHYAELPFQWKIGGAYIQGAMDRVVRRQDGTWVVVDYKSSISEEAEARYRFQLESYMAAVAAYAREKYKEEPRVEGLLVDLYAAESHPVAVDLARATRKLEEEIAKVREGYTLASTPRFYLEQGLVGGEHCFSCPYSLHCDVGKQIVLTFS